MGRSGLLKKLQSLVSDKQEDSEEDSSVTEYMKLIGKKQHNGQIQHIPPNRGNYLAPAQIVFSEIVRELVTSLGFGFYDDSIRNYLIDFMITCQFPLPRSQLLFILMHVICICLAYKDESKLKDLTLL